MAKLKLELSNGTEIFVAGIKDSRLTEMIDATSILNFYKDKIPNPDPDVGGVIDNPVSKTKFALNIFRNTLRDIFIANLTRYREDVTVPIRQQVEIDVDKDEIKEG
ncbi:MAG: hypothetical protein ACXABY_27710 [Candidatus Thorarchaeota archaeon]|jgi:hypothetical protein